MSHSSQRIHHNITDLNDLAFGCGLPSSEVHTMTKLHSLPILTNALTAYHSVLITRLFSITDCDPCMSETLFGNGDEWNPKSTTNIRESSLKMNDLKINSRFAIGIIIPVESNNFINEVIINNWNELSHFLTFLQKIVYRRLLHQFHLGFDNCHGCEYLVKKRLQFPNFILQHDYDLHLQLNKLIKLIHYSNNTPRLMNTNHLMKTDLPEYSSCLINWVLEVLNWLELKDGKCAGAGNPGASFLATVLSLLVQYRSSLGVRPYFNKQTNVREVTRVVVMTGNPAVAKRLVCIMNGLIPNAESLEKEQLGDELVDLSAVTSNTISNSNSNSNADSQVDRSWESSIDTSNSEEVRGVTRPSPSIPIKSTTATTTTNTARAQNVPIGIPIKTPTTSQASSSLSKSASTAQLSTSLSSSYSSLQSNFSLSKFGSGGSFAEKWKNSFGHSNGGGSGVGGGNAPLSSLANPMSGYFDEQSSLNTKKSIQSLRAPSPAFEYDDHSWQPPYSSVASPLSSGSYKLSRTQSMHDLYNQNMNSMSEEHLCDASDQSSTSSSSSTVHNSNASTSGLSNNVLDLKRLKTSVFTPLISDDLVKNVCEYNRNKISRKCRNIMQKSQVYSKSEADGSLQVKIPEDVKKPPIFKHKILLPSVGFCDEYRPEFILQSCPINHKLEQQIMGSMKNDLIYFQNNYKYAQVKIRTILISLRAREVKTIEMYVSNNNDQGESTCPNPALLDDNRPPVQNTYRTKLTKVFSPTKCLGDNELIGKIEATLDEIDQLCKEHQPQHLHQDFTHDPQKKASIKEHFHKKLYSLVLELIG
ncbi:uncharacterized protein LODBEIA_P46070 [Lodderomyces beijingensis]|uniref:LST4 longin domain-containing protein n=1 Tax=Lodderomyces beijingensis TaxID=1775926 RepID=A0ABP0ZRS5_9ASCO